MNLGYEWDIGHFHGAQRPYVDCFRSTSFGLSPTEVSLYDVTLLTSIFGLNIYIWGHVYNQQVCLGGVFLRVLYWHPKFINLTLKTI